MAASSAVVARESFRFANPLHVQLRHQLAASLLLLLHLSGAVTVATPCILPASPQLHTCSIAQGAATASQNTVTAAAAGSLGVRVFQTSWSLFCSWWIETVKLPSPYAPPQHVVIATPNKGGTYPVILFKHGFLSANCFYTELLKSLAALGYIVVAPQSLPTHEHDCTDEIEETAEVANWVSNSLAVVLNTALPGAHVIPNTSQMVMAGHSRGGKIAFAVALGNVSKEVPSFSALIALDPVDRPSSDFKLDPPIVAPGCSHTSNQLSIPVLILGTGYGNDSSFHPRPTCAPPCCSHMAYFNCLSAPTMYHFVASHYGHLDFLDDWQIWTGWLCKGGDSKAPLRSFSVMLMQAFLESALAGEQEEMKYMLDHWENAPITLEKPLVYNETKALGGTDYTCMCKGGEHMPPYN